MLSQDTPAGAWWLNTFLTLHTSTITKPTPAKFACSRLLCSLTGSPGGLGTVRRVPLALRAAQQRITPDVQIGCISCASGDGKFGGPIWWNTPLGEEDVPASQHRATWAPAPPAGPPPSRKRSLLRPPSHPLSKTVISNILHHLHACIVA